MLKRWTREEDRSIARQLKKGIVIGSVTVPRRKKGDIRKRAYRIKLIVKYKPAIKRREQRWAIVKACLASGDKTQKQLVAESGLTDDIIRAVLEQNRSEIHISGRMVESPKGRRYGTVWALGAGEDKPEFDRDDSLAAVLFESRGDPEAAMIAEARERLREVEERGELIRRDPFVAALFGKYTPAPRVSL
jgi:hypothetical protein